MIGSLSGTEVMTVEYTKHDNYRAQMIQSIDNLKAFCQEKEAINIPMQL